MRRSRPTAGRPAPIGLWLKTAKLIGALNQQRENTVSTTVETKPGHIYGA